MKKVVKSLNTLEPNESLKKELYKIYTEIFKSTILSENKKIKVLNTLFAYEPWSWRVVGISKRAIRTFVRNKLPSPDKLKISSCI